jgi:hypothetical protein
MGSGLAWNTPSCTSDSNRLPQKDAPFFQRNVACARSRHFYGVIQSWRIDAVVSGLRVFLPIALGDLGHFFCSGTKPTSFSVAQILQNSGNHASASEMYVSSLRAHSMEQSSFIPLLRQILNLDRV